MTAMTEGKVKPPFSAHHREGLLQAMSQRKLDTLIIGGGITGAGILLDAATRGLRAGLVEMQDFASGTSSRSTKLVHGGLRYLKGLELGVVAEAGKERAIVYENGPHVTSPEWMLLPLYKGGSFGKLSTSWGLRLYDWLAGVKKAERRAMLNQAEVIDKEPLLKRAGLKGGGYYVEYRTDDARLTIEVLKKAVECGGSAVNYAKAEQLLKDETGRLIGVLVRDRVTDQTYRIEAAKVINASGPWVDELRELDGSKAGKTLRLTKGVHLVFDGARFPLRQACYFDTPDGRMAFAIPREGKTYFGTTDTDYREDPVHPVMTASDRAYLLSAANFIFPELALREEDVESSWAGVRPLLQQEGKAPSEVSRRDEIFVSPSGLISIAGGKLTGYRRMAQAVVDRVIKLLQEEGDVRSFQPCVTKLLPISGGETGGSDRFEAYAAAKTAEGMAHGLSEQAAAKLARRYGSNIDHVYVYRREADRWAHRFCMPTGLALGLIYAIREEMAVRPSDFFVRRTGDLLFQIDYVRKWSRPVMFAMSKELNWDGEQREAYAEELERLLMEAVIPVG
ncbi:FAD-dependent oxidoreductase [Paenibacillus sp. PL2-23]|uniref:glycerol-3-phosphate dehydrogenase/oxidase n=1 Tax=Paenibacillus sp. PL2-23 TaxID=2100729 RepID=UPI0030F52282